MVKIFEIKANLVGMKFEISRTFQVESIINLQILHEVFQALFSWENFHLHFYQDADGKDIKKEDQVLLEQVLAKNRNLKYVYDYGDSWTLDLTLIKTFEDPDLSKYPRCIDGKRHSPPEDSGGVTGYEMSLELMEGDKKKEYSLITEWYGNDFDPEYFNIDDVNKALSSIRG
ncbi:MAG: plasmid pRiA4b ORF-3 family protein [Tenuifilaceae bacterium]